MIIATATSNWVCISLKKRVGNTLVVRATFIRVRNPEHTCSELIPEQTIIQSVVAKIRGEFVSSCRKWVIESATQILHWLRAVFKLLLHHTSRSLREIGGVTWIRRALHTFHNHLVLRFIWFFLNWDDLFGQGSVPYFLVNCFLRNVFLDGIKRILIGNINSSVSLRLRGLNANLNP